MPAKTESQRRLFAIAEHHPEELYDRNKSLLKLSHKQLHEFSSSVKPKRKLSEEIKKR